MPLKIIWSIRAKKSYIRVADFILEKWSVKEVRNFTDKSSAVINKIKVNPEMFPASSKRNIRKVVISKQNSLLYRIGKREIELLFFWDNRQNPKKLKL